MERMLLETFVAHKDKHSTGKWKSPALKRKVLAEFSDKAHVTYTWKQIKDRHDVLRCFHVCFKKAKDKSGAGWKEGPPAKLVLAPDAWKDFCATNPIAKDFKDNGWELWDMADSLYSETSATGEYSYNPAVIEEALDSGAEDASGNDSESDKGAATRLATSPVIDPNTIVWGFTPAHGEMVAAQKAMLFAILSGSCEPPIEDMASAVFEFCVTDSKEESSFSQDEAGGDESMEETEDGEWGELATETGSTASRVSLEILE
ncbi:hypothetical protein M427DRAFT_34540 [Gonapodya prolifera JEL478]|uniref:Myb/SANT-like domain-containing protein n=1 Tax=Gonapodya prolifera (strain JEL478) TaxID=1344416 RepID=A0A139A7C8_GONPJ|nr:hypothetical protein M427DRAFT_34540 [Gonapodya prolifera JEL478]|eukprot:KXS12711.1 hypothetical protein M427DRAFT_34540 [Gonapodya prolifera JEL478]